MITMSNVRRVLVDECGWEEQERGGEVVFRTFAGPLTGSGRIALTSKEAVSASEARALCAEVVACGLTESEGDARRLFDDGSGN